MSDAGSTVVLTATRAIVFALGAATTLVSYRAYRASGTRYLRDATAGFAIITVGVLLEGLLFQLTALSLPQVHIVESVAIGVGFLVLLRSFLR
ncbi:DUF7521 family protein [Halosimplex amylolyticum]|uniref:DUF7521 family protein n=1 Tax=Halosimplex amylolyticum TaxID=3396616 RepID=UPI003F577B96